MNVHFRAALEQAAEPYRREGFTVVSQSEDAIMLGNQGEQFNYLIFVASLILFWPLAVYYLVSFNSRRSRTVCLRLTSQGHIDESGYTLDSLIRDRRRDRLVGLLALGMFLLLALIAVSFLVAPRPRIQ